MDFGERGCECALVVILFLFLLCAVYRRRCCGFYGWLGFVDFAVGFRWSSGLWFYKTRGERKLGEGSGLLVNQTRGERDFEGRERKWRVELK